VRQLTAWSRDLRVTADGEGSWRWPVRSGTQFAAAAALVAAQGAKLLLVPAQNMMRRAAATRWKDEHHRIRCERARETGVWLVSADVTGARDAHRVGYGPTSVIDPYGEVVAQVPLMTTGMVVADIADPGDRSEVS